MLTESEYRQRCREKQDMERQARGESTPERGYDAALPSNLTPRQKLDIANTNFEKRGDGFVEAPLTDEERGMSEFAFSQLSPRQRLERANQAMLSRRGVV